MVLQSSYNPFPDLGLSFKKLKFICEIEGRAAGADEISRGIRAALVSKEPASKIVTWLQSEARKDDFKVRIAIGSELMNLLNEL